MAGEGESVIARILPLLLTAAVSWAQEGWLLVEATAYCGGPCEKCETKGVTANGTRVNSRPYGIAGSPNLGLGSRVYIPTGAGYLDQVSPDARWFTIDDRGGAVASEWRRSGIARIDLRYKTHWSAQQFGRKLIMVYIMPGDK
jgi:3D (Asp-Asp-Asp) domain-containing protein